jgi:hypothetical protein
MATLSVAPGLYTWAVEYEDGSSRPVLASSLASLGAGISASDIVSAVRGPSFEAALDAAPVLSSLVPATAVLGAASFTLHVHGTGFTQQSTIIWNGLPEPTTYVSATELTTGVNMSTANVAIALPVTVRTVAGQDSNALTFTLTAAADPPAL